MIKFALTHGGKIVLLSLCVISLTNCGGSAFAPSPSVPSYYTGGNSLNSNSVSNVNRTVVKTGSLRLKTSNIREAAETVEQIVARSSGYMTSMSERDDKSKYAQFEIRVLAQNLVSMMDEIAQLGMVKYRKISVADVTEEAIRQTARLNKLKAKRDRLKALYKNSKTITDKLKVEELLSEIEEQIFGMEEAIKQMQKTSQYSQLSVNLSQSKIRGPLGLVKDTSTWTWKKLFTIRE